jgi:uncharacterized protein (TIGR03435 family)
MRWLTSQGIGAGFVCAAFFVATTGLCAGQAKPRPGPSNPAQSDYRFEVAAIHQADPSGRMSGPPSPPGAGRFISENTTIVALAMRAFGLEQGYQIGYKPWMLSTHFSVNANYPDGATRANLPIMVQHLLEDRFGLVFHRETRQMDGYELVVTKSGPKFAKSVPLTSEGQAVTGAGVVEKNGKPEFTATASGILMTVNGVILRGSNKTMKDLAGYLANYLHNPVIDATGLSGAYDYNVTFTSEMETGPANVAPPTGADDRLASLPLGDALQRQLGLKLQSAKKIPTEVVVLDDANKTPSEN